MYRPENIALREAELVRDDVLPSLLEEGKNPSSSLVSGENFGKKLNDTLEEKVQEYRENEELKALADVQEIINAIVEQREVQDEFEEVKQEMVEEKGRFEQGRVILEEDLWEEES